MVRLPRPEKIYVKVNSDFDSTGFMQPRSITWADGRVFQIDSVKDFRPASSVSRGLPGDCYTVMIKGETKHLFFERSDSDDSRKESENCLKSSDAWCIMHKVILNDGF